MDVRLTVYFDDPFWAGLFEKVSDGRLSASRVVFGAEPRDQEVWEFILRHYHELEFSPAVEAGVRQSADSPKRRQRSASKLLTSPAVGTKSQRALALQRESMKSLKKQAENKLLRDDRQQKYELRQQKQKDKHRGR